MTLCNNDQHILGDKSQIPQFTHLTRNRELSLQLVAESYSRYRQEKHLKYHWPLNVDKAISEVTNFKLQVIHVQEALDTLDFSPAQR